MLHVIFVLLVLLYINVIEEYFVSSLGSEALQIKINTNVTATIGDTNVELWCSYIKDINVMYTFKSVLGAIVAAIAL
jgi:hypothetical protein